MPYEIPIAIVLMRNGAKVHTAFAAFVSIIVKSNHEKKHGETIARDKPNRPDFNAERL